MKENVKLAYGLAAVLLIVGGLCYSVGSEPQPPEPIRIVFSGVSGDVLFNHEGHLYYEGDCSVCHHHGDSSEFMACGTCHKKKVPQTVPQICSDCHPLAEDPFSYNEHHRRILEEDPGAYACKDCHQMKKGEKLPYACGDCHDPYDPYFAETAERIEMKYQKQADAFHSQCIGCHEDYGAGPVKCNMCHAQ